MSLTPQETGGPAGSRALPAATLALGAALLVGAVALAVVAARGPAPARSLQDRVRAVAVTLRCPVCQDLSVADSPSPLARQMRGIIGADLSGGMTAEAVRRHFVDQYGEWILLAPPRRGVDLVAWLIPIVLLTGGVILAAAAVRRWTRSSFAGRVPAGEANSSSADGSLSASDRRLLDRALSAAGEDAE